MTEIKSAGEAELAAIMGKGQGKAPAAGIEKPATAAPRPYMMFDAGEVQQESGSAGIRFDFNYGVRVTVPQGEYRVKFIDRKACLTVYDAPASGVLVTSSKKYFIDFRIEVYEKDQLIFAHDLDLRGKKVLLKFPVGILGSWPGSPTRKPSGKNTAASFTAPWPQNWPHCSNRPTRK